MHTYYRHILSLLLATFLLLEGCGRGGDSFMIKGKFDGMNAGELYLYNPFAPDGKVDTLNIVDGEFRYESSTDAPMAFILMFPNAMEQVIFAAPDKTIKYHAAANDLKNYTVEGSEENTLMARFREEIGTADISNQKSIAARYIEENASSIVALYILDRYFIQSAVPNIKETKRLVKILSEAQPNNHYIIKKEQELQTTAVQLAVGNTLPDLTLSTRSQKSVKLWENGKDINLIFFWATWQRNSYDMIWRIRSLQTANKDNSNVRFVGVSLDSEIYRWQDQTRMDTLTIEHYCDGLSFASPELQKLNITTLPTYVIVDKNRKITASSNNIDDIINKFNQMLK